VEADPVGIEGGENHLYIYVGNNVVNAIDPWGLTPKPLPPDRTRTRNCNNSEYLDCQAICGQRGVQSCKVSQTWRITRIKDGLTVWQWKDGPMSCSCNEEPKKCLKEPPWWVPIIPFIPFLTPWPDPY
jgi:hypothetical protein